MYESKRRAQEADGLSAAFSLTQHRGEPVEFQALGAQNKSTPGSTKSFEDQMQVMRQGGIGQHRGVIHGEAGLVVPAAFLRVGRTTRHPHRFGLLGGYTAECQLFERPYWHRRNLPPVLYSLGRSLASLTVFMIGHIGVILIRKETYCQRVKGIIVQRLFYPPM